MKKILFIITAIVLVALIILLLLLAIFSKKGSKPTPPNATQNTPSINIENPISPLQKVELGKTTDTQIEKIQGINLISTNGEIKTYQAPSIIIAQPNEIKTTNGKATSERIVLPAYDNQQGYTSLSQILQEYGQPEEVLKGSPFYGDYTSRYVYPSKGLLFTVNTNTNEVFEILHFIPMNFTQFEKAFPDEAKTIPQSIAP